MMFPMIVGITERFSANPLPRNLIPGRERRRGPFGGDTLEDFVRKLRVSRCFTLQSEPPLSLYRGNAEFAMQIAAVYSR